MRTKKADTLVYMVSLHKTEKDFLQDISATSAKKSSFLIKSIMRDYFTFLSLFSRRFFSVSI